MSGDIGRLNHFKYYCSDFDEEKLKRSEDVKFIFKAV